MLAHRPRKPARRGIYSPAGRFVSTQFTLLQKPLIYYYGIVLVALMLFNFLLMARFLENSSKNLFLGLDIYLQVCGSGRHELS
jgi:hypothetical protein